MEADSGMALTTLKVDGGASANNFLMQAQADIVNVPVIRPRCVETTAMGAAYLAGLATGYWADKEEVMQNWESDQTFAPAATDADRKKESPAGTRQSSTPTAGRNRNRMRIEVTLTPIRPLKRALKSGCVKCPFSFYSFSKDWVIIKTSVKNIKEVLRIWDF